jgi:hypothetical protein
MVLTNVVLTNVPIYDEGPCTGGGGGGGVKMLFAFTKRVTELLYLARASSTTCLLGAPSLAAGMASIISLMTTMSPAWVKALRFSSRVQLGGSSSVGHSRLYNLRHPSLSVPTFQYGCSEASNVA